MRTPAPSWPQKPDSGSQKPAMEEKAALVTLRPGWKLPWSSTGAWTRMREKETQVRVGSGECAEQRGSGVKEEGVWALRVTGLETLDRREAGDTLRRRVGLGLVTWAWFKPQLLCCCNLQMLLTLPSLSFLT